MGDWEINISKYKIGKINNSNEESPVKAGGGWWQMCFAAANWCWGLGSRRKNRHSD